jgi:hypothetical protein
MAWAGAAPAHLNPLLSTPAIAVAVGILVVLALAGGIRPAVRAGHTRPVEALRSDADTIKAMGWGRWIGGGAFLALTAVAAIAVAAPGHGIDSASDKVGYALLLCGALLTAFALWGPLLVKILLASGVDASSATVIPLAIAVALIASCSAPATRSPTRPVKRPDQASTSAASSS